jgi:aryl-alcohol dehydrogenase-like predicted oxidoreductase
MIPWRFTYLCWNRETLDLLQLHCPPTAVYYQPEVFEVLDELKQAGKILHYGVSVEKVEEALKAIEYPGVATIQIIFNIFRQGPKDLFFPLAQQRDIGILVRSSAFGRPAEQKNHPSDGFNRGRGFRAEGLCHAVNRRKDRRAAAVKGRIAASTKGSAGIEPQTEGIKGPETRKTGCRARPQESRQYPQRLAVETGPHAGHGI